MKAKVLIILGIFFFLLSCKQKTSVTGKELNSQPEITKVETVTAQFVENDSLAYAWETELERIAEDYPKFKLVKEPYENHHDENVMDTIKTLMYSNSEIIFYKARNFEAIMSARIEDPEFIISEIIKIGMNKKILEKQLKTEIRSDTLKIGNIEQTTLFSFIFEHAELKKIDFYGYVD